MVLQAISHINNLIEHYPGLLSIQFSYQGFITINTKANETIILTGGEDVEEYLCKKFGDEKPKQTN